MGGGEKEIPPSFGKYEANFLPAVRLSQQLRLGAPKVSWSVSVWVLWFLQPRQTLYEGVDKGIQLLNSFFFYCTTIPNVYMASQPKRSKLTKRAAARGRVESVIWFGLGFSIGGVDHTVVIIPGLADFVLGCKRGTWQPVVQLIETSVWLSVLMRRDIAPTYHTATHNRHHLRRTSESLIRIIDFGKNNFFSVRSLLTISNALLRHIFISW